VSKPTVVFLAAPGAPAPAGLHAVAQVAELVVAEDASMLREALARAQIALVWDFQTPLLREVGPGGLSWIHASSIGVDALITPEIIRAPVTVTNTRGVYERPMAEYVLAALLLMAKDLRRTLALQRQGQWRPRLTEALAERRVLVLGPGAVGREITQLLRAVGMHVRIVGRRARDDEPGLGRVEGIDDLDRLLSKADDLVVALPLTSATRGILTTQRLAQLPWGARVINVGRGPLIDEPALLEALRSGQVGAAVLDVFEREPLPDGHPFWTADNVLVSPHMSGDVAGWEAKVIDGFLDNLERWSRGEPLRNVVVKQSFAAGGAP
jgi:phosphoglycerate dehydrogenase-like enzyme